MSERISDAELNELEEENKKDYPRYFNAELVIERLIGELRKERKQMELIFSRQSGRSPMMDLIDLLRRNDELLDLLAHHAEGSLREGWDEVEQLRKENTKWLKGEEE